MLKVSRSFLRDQLYESLVEAILTNHYSPGEVLPIERLADDFGVSPTPLREAMIRLESAGLVTVLPNRRAQVKQITADDVVNLWEVRKLLEPYAARKLVTSGSLNGEAKSELERVRAKLLAVMNNPGDLTSYIESDIGLHLFLRGVSNAVLEDFLNKISLQYMRIRYYAEGRSSARAEVVKLITSEHLRIADALAAADPYAAEHAVYEHLVNSEKRTLATLQQTLDGTREQA